MGRGEAVNLRGLGAAQESPLRQAQHASSAICPSNHARSLFHTALSGETGQPNHDGPALAQGSSAFALSAVLLNALASLAYDTERSRCQPALPGSDFARRAVAVGGQRAGEVALRDPHVAHFIVGHREIALPAGVAGIGCRGRRSARRRGRPARPARPARRPRYCTTPRDPRCQPALPGSDFARRSKIARLSR